MPRRFLSLLLSVLFLFSFSAQAFADDDDWDDDDDFYYYEDADSYDADEYYDMINDVMERMDSVNQKCSGGLQMQSNGMYRLVEMFAIIAGRISESSETTDSIRDILDEWDRKNDKARSATEQIINGSYRCFDLLSLIAWEMDKNDEFADSISEYTDNFAIGNNTSQTAEQLLTNGFYSCDDLLYIIAQENSTSDTKSDNVNDSYNSMHSTDRTLNSEVSRQLNAVNYMLVFLLHICQELDHTSSRNWANKGRETYDEAKSFCEGVSDINERIASKLYFCVDMAGTIACELA